LKIGETRRAIKTRCPNLEVRVRMYSPSDLSEFYDSEDDGWFDEIGEMAEGLRHGLSEAYADASAEDLELVVCRGFGDPVEGGLASCDSFDDFVGGAGPYEWFGVAVPVLDPPVDAVLEVAG